MPSLAVVVRQHGPLYEARFGGALLPSHARALKDIRRCRTAAMGGHLSECAQCGKRHLVYHSCRNRACAQCGGDRAAAWLARQREQLLPVPYFHVVFTLPAELRKLVRSNQQALLPVLFQSAFQSLSALCADTRHLGGRIGALAVLHTWTRTLEWHPHVHMLVPGGALSPSGQWIATRRPTKHAGVRFLVPVKALSVGFRGRFLRMARKALPQSDIPHVPKQKRWVVYAKPIVCGAERVLDYLGRYVQKTAISDRAILGSNDDAVTFRYRDSRDQKSKVMTLPGAEFLRRFLQHALPRGLHRTRSFGLLAPANRAILRRLQLLLGAPPEAGSPENEQRNARTSHCLRCGGPTTRGPRLSPDACAEALLDAAAPPVLAAARAPPQTGVAA